MGELESQCTKYPGIPGTVLGRPRHGGVLESQCTKYPRIPGTVLGRPRHGGVLESQCTKYPRIPGTVLGRPRHGGVLEYLVSRDPRDCPGTSKAWGSLGVLSIPGFQGLSWDVQGMGESWST